MSKQELKNFMSGLWDVFKRSLGLAMISFVPAGGMGTAFGADFLTSGLIGFGAIFSIVMMVLGTELASTSEITSKGIDDAFKQAVTKAQNKKTK
jgi:uncharacterized membrane protein YraQ (UPF0718 family)